MSFLCRVSIGVFAACFWSSLAFAAPGARAVEGKKSASLYQVPLNWRNESGKPVKFSDWKGQKVVVTMIYTSCKYTCPLTIKKLKEVENHQKSKGLSAKYLLVSFDPVTDTPAHLTKFRENAELKDPSWTFLTGSESAVRKLSMLLGIKYSKNPQSGEIMHDNKFVLLNEAGEVTQSLDGLDADISAFF